MERMKKKILFVVNVDWFFLSHRLEIALGAINQKYEVHLATHQTLPIEMIQRHGIIMHSLMVKRSSMNPYGILKYCYDLNSIFSSVKPDIVHLVTIKPVIFGGIVARLKNIPAVVFAISGMGYLYINKNPGYVFIKKLTGLIYKTALQHKNSFVICQNSADLKLVTDITKINQENSRIIPGSGINLEQYHSSNIVFQNKRKLVVMFASRLLKDKGLCEFVEASRHLKRFSKDTKNLPNLKFVVLGEVDHGNNASVSMADIDSWESEGLIDYWGHIEAMETVLTKADIFVLPSYREGMPKVLLEAAACSLPIITTDVPGCRDAILPDITGILVPPRNSAALAEAIRSLALNPEKSILLGKNGRQHAHASFDVNLVVKEHLEIYERLNSQIVSS